MWDPIVTPSTLLCMAEMAAIYTLMEEAARPLSRQDWRKMRITGMERHVGSWFCAWHYSEKNFHLLAYNTLVEDAWELWMVCTTSGSHSLNNGSGPSEARPKVAAGMGSGTRFDPPAVRGDPSSQGDTKAPCRVICVIVWTTLSPVICRLLVEPCDSP